MNRKFFDIKHPGQKSPTPRVVLVPIDIPYIPISQPEPKSLPEVNFKVPIIGIAAVFLFILGFFGFNLIRFKHQAAESAPIIYDRFKQGASALINLDLEQAKDTFKKVSEDLQVLNSQAPVKTLPSILGNLFKISQDAVGLSSELEELKSNGLALFINKRGAILIGHFKAIREHLSEMGNLSANLQSQASNLGYNVGEEFTGVSSKLSGAEKFLANLIDWLETPKKQRLLIFFQNPSEIRPSGGFIGSYGHATFFQGNLLSLEVRDIYDPDGQLDLKVVPPKPLQGITDKWGARDANWFFDFPTSAQKVTDFLEASKIYKEQGIKFSGAIAVNIEAIKDILDVVGPIDLSDYGLTVNSENFLGIIQKEVESGKDKARGEPKKILQVLTPIIFEKLSKLDEAPKEDLVKKLALRFGKKDIMVYFKDKIIEDYLKNLGVAGEVINLPPDFTGDYLAVANSNVAGGKSDAKIEQNLNLQVKIDNLGQIKNHLTIERKHNGKDEKDWWYRATNRDYLQIFTTAGSRLLKVRGASQKTIKPLVDYKKENYLTDSALTELEKKDAVMFGKTVFPQWLETKAGEKKKLELDYASPSRINLAGGSYQFVFEKQSGINTGLEISIEAPAGYHWKENNGRIFNYSGQDLTARTFVNLTPEADRR